MGHWLAATFGVGHCTDLRPVARGAMGEVHRLSTDSGTFAAKRYFWDESGLPHAEFSEAFAQRCRSAGVPAPSVVRARSGALLAHDDFGAWWQVAHWVSGTKPVADDIDSGDWLVRQTALIHQIGQKPDWESILDPFYSRCAVDWRALSDRAHAESVPWATKLAARTGDLTELASWAHDVPVAELLISHNDLVLDNVLVDGVRRWVIDWDNVGPQDPARELGVQLFGTLSDPGRTAGLLASYRRAGGVDIRWGVDVFASAVAIRLNYLALQADLLVDPAQHVHHDFARAQVLPLLRNLPTLAQLRQHVDAVELPSDV